MAVSYAKMTRTPRRVQGPIVLGLVLYGAAPFLDAHYYSSMLRRGAYPVGGDTIAIPVGLSFAASLLFAPIFAALLWVALRQYVPKAPLGLWRRDRPTLSWVATLGCLLVAVMVVASVVYMASESFWIYALHGVGVIYFLAVARASFLVGLGPGGEGSRSRTATQY
jgi:hypothetical protein